MMRRLTKPATVAALLILGSCWALSAQAVPWMYQPTNQPGSLGNNYFEFQDYGSGPYYHDGIDVMQSTGGVHVYSVSDGWMTHETPGTMYGGLMIGDQYAAGATGWLYWHLPNSTYPFNVGDRIYEGDYLGDIAYWTVANFHHTHFNRVVGTGSLPWSWYESIGNPLDFLQPDTDPQPPLIHDAQGTNLLAFCVNNTSTYVNPNNLYGDVDIIAKLGDKFWNNQWEIVPYRIAYTIAGLGIYDHRLAFLFGGALPDDNTLPVVYKDDMVCNSAGDYSNRNFYFILTNHDNDSLVEITDNTGKWHTAGYPGGAYTLTVQTWDAYGNLAQDSMNVNLPGVPSHDVSVTLTPTSSLTLPASGGSFTYTVNVHNNETIAVNNFDGWIDMTYPAGNTVNVLLRSLNLPAGSTITRNLTQTIAGSEPNGTYSYIAKAGYSPYNTWGTGGFTFTKGVDGFDLGPEVAQTTLSGWEDENLVQEGIADRLPESPNLMRVYPNPFNPTTTLSFSLTHSGEVKLAIYDLTGRRLATLMEGWQEAGLQEISLDGSHLATGLYIYRLQVNQISATGKLILLK